MKNRNRSECRVYADDLLWTAFIHSHAMPVPVGSHLHGLCIHIYRNQTVHNTTPAFKLVIKHQCKLDECKKTFLKNKLRILNEELDIEYDRISEAIEKLANCTTKEQAEIIGIERARQIVALFAGDQQLGDPLQGIDTKLDSATIKKAQQKYIDSNLRVVEGLKKLLLG